MTEPQDHTGGSELFTRWLANPSSDKGIHAREAGGWVFYSYAAIAAAARSLACRLAVRDAGGVPPRVAILSEHAPTVLAGFGAAWLLRGAAHVLPQPLAFRQWPNFVCQVEHVIGLVGCRHLVFDLGSADTAAELGRSLMSDVDMLPVSLGGGADGGAIGGIGGIGGTEPGTVAYAPLPARRAEDVVLHQFTSGSTGRPKLIEVTAGNLSANLASMRHWLGWRDGRDGWASWLPLHHDMGLVGGLFVPAAYASDLWSLPPGDFLRSPGTWLEALSAGKGTVTAAPTFGYAYAAKRVGELPAGTDLRNWRVACIAAEMVTEDVLNLFTDRFSVHGYSHQTWCPAYGLAEATLCVTTVGPDEPTRIARLARDAAFRPGEPVPVLGVHDIGVHDVDGQDIGTAAGRALVGCGRPVRDVLVDIVDEQGKSLPDGYFGEIVVRGPSVATVRDKAAGSAGAAHLAQAAQAAKAAKADRAYTTGDGGIKIDGELFVVGRLGDGVKVRGEFVDCEGLERRLATALGVAPERSALAIGQVGAEIHAIFLTRAGMPVAEAVARAETVVRALLGDGARLAVHPVAAEGIPKTSSGKVKRREIWNRWAPGAQVVPGLEGAKHASAGYRG